MEKYSIIIPTHNRQNFIRKNVEYFSKFKECTVYIVDSSEKAYTYEFPLNIRYIHMPDKSFVQKMREVLIMVDTEYVATCADDDFIIEDRVNEFIDELREKKYIMGVGRYYSFNIPFNGFKPLYHCHKLPSVEAHLHSDRIKSYMKNYYISLWGIYNTKILYESYEILSKSKYNNDNFIELVIAINMAVNGKILMSNKVWGVREAITGKESWGRKQENLMKYSNCSNNEFSLDVENISQYFSDSSFINGVNYYFDSHKKNFFGKIVRRLRCIFNNYRYKNTYQNDSIVQLINTYYKSNQ